MCNSSKITENLKDICLSFEKRAALKFIGNFCSKFSLNFEEAYLNSSSRITSALSRFVIIMMQERVFV